MSVRFREVLNILQEDPYYKEVGLTVTDPLTKISKQQKERAWKLIYEFDGGIQIRQRSDGLGFILGIEKDEYFLIYSQLACTKPRIGSPKLKNSIQIEMVHTMPEWRNSNYTKKLYEIVAKTCVLISDFEQYGRSKDLWKSLARDSDINVYIYNNLNKKLSKYNSENINENEIWGTEAKHISTVLVGADKELKI